MDTLPKLSIRQFDHCKMIMNGVRRLKVRSPLRSPFTCRCGAFESYGG